MIPVSAPLRDQVYSHLCQQAGPLVRDHVRAQVIDPVFETEASES